MTESVITSESRFRAVTTIVYLDIRSIFRYLISMYIICFLHDFDLNKSHKQFLEPDATKLKKISSIVRPKQEAKQEDIHVFRRK